MHFGWSVPDAPNGITQCAGPFRCKCSGCSKIEARITRPWRACSPAAVVKSGEAARLSKKKEKKEQKVMRPYSAWRAQIHHPRERVGEIGVFTIANRATSASRVRVNTQWLIFLSRIRDKWMHIKRLFNMQKIRTTSRADEHVIAIASLRMDIMLCECTSRNRKRSVGALNEFFLFVPLSFSLLPFVEILKPQHTWVQRQWIRSIVLGPKKPQPMVG